jgi:hypothetical protein
MNIGSKLTQAIHESWEDSAAAAIKQLLSTSEAINNTRRAVRSIPEK